MQAVKLEEKEETAETFDTARALKILCKSLRAKRLPKDRKMEWVKGGSILSKPKEKEWRLHNEHSLCPVGFCQ